MTIEAKIIADSISEEGNRLQTMQLYYPRVIHSQVLTHRAFSRNASSSRAIPTSKLISLATDDMYEPVRYGKNQGGMQASDECLVEADLDEARSIWYDMADYCAQGVKRLNELKLHKQWANRPLEWFSHISVVVSATEWRNFYDLRCHASPSQRLTSWRMPCSTPVERRPHATSPTEGGTSPTSVRMRSTTMVATPSSRCRRPGVRVSHTSHTKGRHQTSTRTSPSTTDW